MDNKPLILVDGSSYLFRAFHAAPPLSSSKGQHTGAVYVVIRMLRKLQKDYPGSLIAVVFDAGSKSFRNEMYAQYKANRPPMPPDLRTQIKPIHDIVAAMGLPLLIIQGVEADDVIGTLATEATLRQQPVVVSTGDKDLAQLVSPHVTLLNTMTETTLDRAGVEEKFGVPPERIVDLLTLMGDSVDNIPGVPKVGPKTAAKWLQQYGSVDEVIARADEISGKVGENLRSVIDLLPLSKQLATVRCNVELPVNLDSIAATAPDTARLLELFRELEFKAWVEELLVAEPATPRQRGSVSYDTVLDLASLDAWVAKLRAAAMFSFAIKTTVIDYMRAELVGMSFATAQGDAAYVPLTHRYPGAPEQLDRDVVLNRLRPLLESDAIIKISQDVKYAMSVLARHGITLRGASFDTMLESYVLDSVGSRHNIDELALKHLGHTAIKLEDVAGKGAKQITFDQVPLETASEYAAEDADITWQLHASLWPRVAAEPTLSYVLRDIEMPLVPVLSKVERHGALVDARVLRQQSAEIADKLGELTGRAYELAGGKFNLDSPKQLQELLYGKLGLPVLRKTPGGQPSTAEEVLDELAADYDLPRVILDYRSLAKLKSTYTDKLPEQVNRETGRIHTSYNQAVAATGRLSSVDPNLQNIPIRTAEGRRIRQAFVAPPGMKLVAADYSQIELRIMAHLSGDAGLRTAFTQGLDVHRATAAEVFGATLAEVSDDQRRSAKAINFGLIYGMSAFGLARQIGVSRATAAEYIQRYFERYPGVRAYMDSTRAMARQRGYVETIFGRRLYLPEINVANVPRRQAAERTAINAPMQGTAADIIKRAMIHVDAWLTAEVPEVSMILQVHDELIFEVPTAMVAEFSDAVRQRMSAAATLDVALEVGVGSGGNWDEAH